MRIISGKYKGRRIFAPTKLPVRPTTDFAKEGLFNIVSGNFDYEHLSVLDLFCGTGNITYEFASRGTEKIVSVDRNFACCSFVKKTANDMGFSNISVIKSDVMNFLRHPGGPYDIVFADPPYKMKGTEDIPNKIAEKKIIKKGGWLIIEHPKEVEFKNPKQLLMQRKYGKVNFSIFSF